jgi:hypothetical protein
MRTYGAVLVMAFVSLAEPGYSQEVVPPPPIRPEDIGKYCIYASRIYSQGSQLCVARGSVTLGCDKGEWKVDLTKFGLDCRTSENAASRPNEPR